MARLPERPNAFFSISPAETGEAKCFAIRRGTGKRLDSWFNHPRYEALNARLDAAPVPTPTLNEFLESIAGGATPSRSNAELYTDSGIRFLRILNIVDGEILDRDMKFIVEGVHTGELNRSQLASGDVLMTITGRVGSAAVVGNGDLPGNINQHIARLRVDKTLCRPAFLSEWLNCLTGLALSDRPVSGGTRIALDYAAIRSIRVPLPSVGIQDSLVRAMDAARATRKAELAEADGLLAGIDEFLFDTLGITLALKSPAEFLRLASRGRGLRSGSIPSTTTPSALRR